MRRIRRKLNRVLVTVDLLLEDMRRHLGLADKALGDAAADVNDPGDARADRDLGHVEHVLNDVELKIVFLLKTRAGDPDRNTALRDPGAKYRHARFVGRS